MQYKTISDQTQPTTPSPWTVQCKENKKGNNATSKSDSNQSTMGDKYEQTEQDKSNKKYAIGAEKYY